MECLVEVVYISIWTNVTWSPGSHQSRPACLCAFPLPDPNSRLVYPKLSPKITPKMEKPEIDPPPRDLAGESDLPAQQTSSSSPTEPSDKDLAASNRGDARPQLRRITPTLVQRLGVNPATPEGKSLQGSPKSLSTSPRSSVRRTARERRWSLLSKYLPAFLSDR